MSADVPPPRDVGGGVPLPGEPGPSEPLPAGPPPAGRPPAGPASGGTAQERWHADEALRDAVAVQEVAVVLAGAEEPEAVATALTEAAVGLHGASGTALLMAGDPAPALVRCVHHPALASVLRDGPSAAGHATRLVDAADDLRCPDDGALRAALPSVADLLLADGDRAWAVVPLRAGRRTLGLWLLSWPPGSLPGPRADRAVRSVAAVASSALDRARVVAEHRAVAVGLQRALLPAGLPELPGAAMVGRYRAGRDGMLVGGDFYDVQRSPDRPVTLMLGDVMGRGVSAAGVMGEVRHTLRAYGSDGHPPGEVLARANSLLLASGGERFATCVYGELDPATGALTLACAGHLPPLLVPTTTGSSDDDPSHDDLPLYLEIGDDLPLGLFPATAFEERTIVLAEGDILVLYTDGLVETPQMGLEEGMGLLRRAAGEVFPGTGTLEAATDALLDRLLPSGTSDDVAVLVLQRTRQPSPDRRAVRRRFPDMPATPRAARRATRDVLNQWGLHEVVDVAELLVSEMVTNAVAHTVGDVELVLEHDEDRLVISAVDTDERAPVLHEPDDARPGGRGVWLVDELSQEWGYELTPGGKRVWCALPVAAAPL